MFLKSKILRLSALFALACLPLAAQMGRQEKAEVTLVADRTAYAPGDGARIAVELDIERDWHVNSHEPTFDYLIPTEVLWEFPDGWPSPTVAYPHDEMEKFGFADVPLAVYQGRVAIIADLVLPSSLADGTQSIAVEVTYQACNDRQCLPPITVDRELELTIGGGGTSQHADIFGTVAGPTKAPAQAAGAARLATMFLLAIVGGLILNAMPCVLPVLSLKLFGLIKNAGLGRGAVIAGGLATSAGILVSFWALALGVVLARSAGNAVGWGVQFQNPLFVTGLAIIVLLFCLNLWGLFEIQLPFFLAQAAGLGRLKGHAGHFVSGLFATLMATPCSAPFLGSAIGFALGQSAATIFLIFTGVGLGMSLPYLVLVAFPGAARFLPKPGAWMETLRGVMAFLLAAALVWLFFVLSGQIPGARVALIEVSLLAMAAFVWIRHQAKKGRRLALLGTVACIAVAMTLSAGATISPDAQEAGVSHLIDWVTFDRAEAERLADSGELVFVDVTADWCFTCKVNERMVLETAPVAEAFERYGVVPMKADWTNRNDAIGAYMAEYERYGIPFYLLYRPGQEPHLFGELITKDGMVEVIAEAGAK